MHILVFTYLYVWRYIYICVYIYTHAIHRHASGVYAHVLYRVNIQARKLILKPMIYLYTYMRACIYLHIYSTYMHACMNAYIHTYIHTYIYTYIRSIPIKDSESPLASAAWLEWFPSAACFGCRAGMRDIWRDGVFRMQWLHFNSV